MTPRNEAARPSLIEVAEDIYVAMSYLRAVELSVEAISPGKLMEPAIALIGEARARLESARAKLGLAAGLSDKPEAAR